MAKLVSDKNILKSKIISETNKALYIEKRVIFSRNIAIINIYACNNRACNYMKQKLTEMKGETDNSIVIVGRFQHPALNKGQNSYVKNKQGNRQYEENYKPTNLTDIIQII